MMNVIFHRTLISVANRDSRVWPKPDKTEDEDRRRPPSRENRDDQ